MALIFDTETTGFARSRDYTELSAHNGARMIQISYVVCTPEFEILAQINRIVKAKGFYIANDHIHGITQQRSINEGHDILDVLTEFYEYLSIVTHVFAHNIGFDLDIVKSEMYRAGKTSYITELDKKTAICTMKLTKPIVKVMGKRCIKNPKLAELYTFATGKVMQNAHDALYDVLNLHESISKLYFDGRISIDGFAKPKQQETVDEKENEVTVNKDEYVGDNTDERENNINTTADNVDLIAELISRLECDEKKETQTIQGTA
jgi:DNA polymerase III epsilon subunit-like protein